MLQRSGSFMTLMSCKTWWSRGSALTAPATCGLWFNTLWESFQCGPHNTRTAKLYSHSPILIAQTMVKPQGCVMLDALIPGLLTWHNDTHAVISFKAFQRFTLPLPHQRFTDVLVAEMQLVIEGETIRTLQPSCPRLVRRLEGKSEIKTVQERDNKQKFKGGKKSHTWVLRSWMVCEGPIWTITAESCVYNRWNNLSNNDTTSGISWRRASVWLYPLIAPTSPVLLIYFSGV